MPILQESPEALNRSVAKVVQGSGYRSRVRKAVEAGNRDLAQVERVRRYVLLDRDFSQEEGELTPTMKVKRKAIEEKFQDLFDRIYTEDGFADEASS